jgi:uncharacterized membrane protein YccC
LSGGNPRPRTRLVSAMDIWAFGRAAAFVGRCAGAAAGAYELTVSLGLPEPLWAVMSALIVSQEKLDETRSSLTGRVLGTLTGIAVTVSVSEIASRAGALSTALQMAIAVAVCALVAHLLPKLRVAMWTCAVILLTAQPAVPIVIVALRRGSEVILGAAIGWAFHWTAEILENALTGATANISTRDDRTGQSRRGN